VKTEHLARKSLGIATLITVPAFGLLVFGVFKLMGVKNVSFFKTTHF